MNNALKHSKIVQKHSNTKLCLQMLINLLNSSSPCDPNISSNGMNSILVLENFHLFVIKFFSTNSTKWWNFNKFEYQPCSSAARLDTQWVTSKQQSGLVTLFCTKSLVSPRNIRKLNLGLNPWGPKESEGWKQGKFSRPISRIYNSIQLKNVIYPSLSLIQDPNRKITNLF